MRGPPVLVLIAGPTGTSGLPPVSSQTSPGAIAGGSGAQYFLGDFDGTHFTADDSGTYTAPRGTVLQDFE
ncbi:hypothetical protein [Streptomyces sp. NPDC007905]|uniref:hypothetical protein n=1 Tax=Streptomyces sp. NPDC007905 TaxID=3364788 RepID=UPI0036EB4FDD